MIISNTTLAVVTANVILTFESQPQTHYDATAVIPLTNVPAEKYQDIEVDVIDQILAQSPEAKLDDLVKISLCYTGRSALNGRGLSKELETVADDIIEFLIRKNAKYYFQPNQRDDYEQRIVDRTGVASKTRDFA